MKQLIRFISILIIVFGCVSFYFLTRPEVVNALRFKIGSGQKQVQTTPVEIGTIDLFSDDNVIIPEAVRPMAALHQPTSCIRTPTAEPAPKPRQVVYTWVDERGRTHFGDQAPEDVVASEVASARPDEMQYFTLNIRYLDGGRVPFLQDRLRVAVTQTFRVLADLIGENRLRAIELNLSVLPDRETFEAYGGGNLDLSVNGFYSPVRNETVTWQHGDPAFTVEVATHESVHAILAGLLGGSYIPLWLNEGLAEYFELIDPRASYNRVPVDSDSLLVARAVSVVEGEVSLREFMSLDAETWADRSDLHYPIAASLVFFLMDSPEGRSALAQLLETMADSYCLPVDSQGVMDSVYPGGVPALQVDFYTWLARVETDREHRH